MRNQAQSWIAKAILGGIILSFALWGVGDYFMGSHVQYVAEVDGNPINHVNFKEAYQRNLNNYSAAFGKQISKTMAQQLNIKSTTLQTMINRQLMLDEAQRLKLAAPEAALLAQVRANPVFQSAKGFDADRYRIITRNMGFRTTRDYEDEQRLNLMINALQKTIIASSTVSDKEIRDRFNRDFEQRVLSAIIVDPSSLTDQIKIDDAAARAYFESHQDQYRSNLNVRLVAVEIDPTSLSSDIVIDDADIEASYDERKGEFTSPEKRHASHILVQLAANADETARSAARKKIEAAKSRLDQGENFAKVAKEISDDVSTNEKGGDLGFFVQGAMVDVFDTTVFAMKKDTVSDIIETQFGLHLVRLNNIQESHSQGFEDVKSTIANDLRKTKASDEAYNISQDLDNALGMEDSLKAAAESVDLTVREIGPISSKETLGDPLLASDQSLRALAFTRMPGDSIEIMELDDGRFVGIEILERIEPDTQAFADVAAKVYADAHEAAAEKMAKDMAKDILTKANGQSLDTLAQSFGQPKYISKPVRSNGLGDEASWLTPDMIDNAFRTAKGNWLNQPIEVSQGLAVVQVESIIEPSNDDFADKKESLEQEVEKSKGAVRFARWMASVRDRHEIVIHQDILDQL
ncbi:MAG: SurA N-terminal domain-containing protein [Mariprofundaceae bacterium]